MSAEEIRRIAHRIMTKDHPLTGWLRGISFEDALSQASEEAIKKIKKKGLRAAKRDKRIREGLPVKERRRKKTGNKDGKSPKKPGSDVKTLDPVDETLTKLLKIRRPREKQESHTLKPEPPELLGTFSERPKKRRGRKKKDNELFSPPEPIIQGKVFTVEDRRPFFNIE